MAFQSTVTFPYSRTLTMQQLSLLGYDVQNMTRQCPVSGYSITIKSVSYDSTTGLLTLNMRAYCDGQELRVKNPWHWYMPFPDGISGSTNLQRLNSFVKMIISVAEILPYGQTENDDSITIYSTVDGFAAELTDANYATIKADVGDSQQSGSGTNTAPYIIATATTDIYNYMRRAILSFNTSVISDSATVTSVIMRLSSSSRIKQLGWDGNTYVYNGTLASGSAIANGDYDGYGTTSLTDNPVVCPNTNVNYNFTFNAAGIAYVQGNLDTGEYTAIFHRDSFDVGTDTPVWALGEAAGCAWVGVAYTGETYDPYLLITYTPVAAAPVAAFTHTCSNHCGAETCSFTDTSTNTPTSWQWEYQVNDGGWLHFPTDDTAQNPAGVEFTTDGEYDIRLTATNGAGSDDETKNNIFNVWEMPIAAFSCNDLDACSNQDITCTDESTGGAGTAWRWRGKRTGVYSTFSTDQNPVEQFAHGLWDIEFRVTTVNSCEDTEEKLDYFSTDDPVTSAFTYGATTICEGGTVSYTDTSTGDEESWGWDCEYDTGDDYVTENAICTYNTAGTYSVEHITDNSGCAFDQELKLNLVHVDGALTAEFSGDDLTICEGDHVHFTDESTGGTVDTWAWDTDGDAITEYTTQNPQHTYSDSGTYTVNLTVDNAGCAASTESKVAYITVEECLWPVCDFSCTPLIGNAPLTVDCTDESTNAPDTWSWSRKTDGSYVEFSTDQNPADIVFNGGNWDVQLNVSNVYGYDVCEELNYIISTKLPGLWVGVLTEGEPEEESSRGFLLLGFILLCGVFLAFTQWRR